MKPNSKRHLGLIVVIALATIFFIRPATLVNHILNWRIRTEETGSGRMALINATLEYDSNFWNQKYVSLALNADSDVERRFMADLISERYGTNAIPKLRDQLAVSSVSESARSNGLAVISALEARSK